MVWLIDSVNDLFKDSFTPLQFITNFVRMIDKELQVEFNDDFEYNIENKRIMIGLEKFLSPDHIEQTTHKELLYKMGFKYKKYCSYETFCLFHELGHHSMNKLYGVGFEEELQEYSNDREYYNKCRENNIIDYKENQELYMLTGMEQDANNWAMLFIKQNKKIVKQFNKLFMKHIEIMLANPS